MQRNVWSDVVSWRTGRLNNSTKYQLHALMTIISKKNWNPWSVGELSKVCSQIVLKCLYLARIGRPDILWSVNKLARSITKWTKACDKRLNRLISYIHHTCDYKQYCHVGNTAKQCRLGLFQDSDFAGDLEDSKSTSGGTLCIFGSHTFVPISWMCKKQTAVSHSSTESEIMSLDAGLRLDGIHALDLWDLIVAVLGNTNQIHDRRRNPLFAVIRITCKASNLEERSRRLRMIRYWETRKNFQRERNLMEWLMIWTMLILFPQTSTLLVRKLCCMCLKTTMQWSRWS